MDLAYFSYPDHMWNQVELGPKSNLEADQWINTNNKNLTKHKASWNDLKLKWIWMQDDNLSGKANIFRY